MIPSVSNSKISPKISGFHSLSGFIQDEVEDSKAAGTLDLGFRKQNSEIKFNL